MKQVNGGFDMLKSHIPSAAKHKKLSKVRNAIKTILQNFSKHPGHSHFQVETLRHAVEYIQTLQKMLNEGKSASEIGSLVMDKKMVIIKSEDEEDEEDGDDEMKEEEEEDSKDDDSQGSPQTSVTSPPPPTTSAPQAATTSTAVTARKSLPQPPPLTLCQTPQQQQQPHFSQTSPYSSHHSPAGAPLTPHTPNTPTPTPTPTAAADSSTSSSFALPPPTTTAAAFGSGSESGYETSTYYTGGSTTVLPHQHHQHHQVPHHQQYHAHMQHHPHLHQQPLQPLRECNSVSPVSSFDHVSISKEKIRLGNHV